MCVMNEFLENRKPSLGYMKPKQGRQLERCSSGRALKWGFDAFTLREGVAQRKPTGMGEKENWNEQRVANNREPRILKIHQAQVTGAGAVASGKQQQTERQGAAGYPEPGFSRFWITEVAGGAKAEGSISAHSRSRRPGTRLYPHSRGPASPSPPEGKSLNVSIGDFLTLQQRTPPSSSSLPS